MSAQAFVSRDFEGVDLKYPAWLETSHGLMECAIIRISSAVAQIRFAHDTAIDENFELWLTRNGACRRPCRLIERNGTILVVDLWRDGRAPSPLPAHQLAC
jgi:hypothetical protein